MYSLQAPRHRHRLPRAGKAGGALAEGGTSVPRAAAGLRERLLQADPGSPRTELHKQGWCQKPREVSQAVGEEKTESCPDSLSLGTGSPTGKALGRMGSPGDGLSRGTGSPWDRLWGGRALWGMGTPAGRAAHGTGSREDGLSGDGLLGGQAPPRDRLSGGQALGRTGDGHPVGQAHPRTTVCLCGKSQGGSVQRLLTSGSPRPCVSAKGAGRTLTQS